MAPTLRDAIRGHISALFLALKCSFPTVLWEPYLCIKVLANEDTLLRTHCCRHKCFLVCPREQHLLRTQILCPGHKNVSDFVQKHFVSATNVSQFARARKRHAQQCFRNNVSSFATALMKKARSVREMASEKDFTRFYT